MLHTPDSLKLGTSSFGAKNSTVQKRDEENTTHFMQSSIRGIIFNDESRRETGYGGDKNYQSKLSQASGLTGDASYQIMQNNLKSLQDKIKNLETKLTMANEHDDSSLLESAFISTNSNRNKAS